MTDTNEHLKAVLLLAFGGPESMDEVGPFLTALMEGRQVSARQMETVKDRYRLIGGSSPLKRITSTQADMLEKALNRAPGDQDTGVVDTYRVFLGMMYTHPLIRESVDGILSSGIRHITAVPLSPYFNSASSGRYLQEFGQAVKGKGIGVRTIRNYNTNGLFIKAVVQTVTDAVRGVDRPFVIFSAHSLPAAAAKADGYVEQLEQTLGLVLKNIPLPEYALAFQSRGMTGTDWLGPDVRDVMNVCAKEGRKNVVVVPFGFVSDHVETLYDIDIVYREHAQGLGLGFGRAQSLNGSELFIQALRDVVIKA
ncbi:MAG: ferrochelatase [Deltaproteobacteria bacterium]|nr:ferrochelatase [Deltaproteobacteria bacterium]MCL5277757.1 ferrochelatase [Deltaproteobacteria bacterium]